MARRRRADPEAGGPRGASAVREIARRARTRIARTSPSIPANGGCGAFTSEAEARSNRLAQNNKTARKVADMQSRISSAGAVITNIPNSGLIAADRHKGCDPMRIAIFMAVIVAAAAAACAGRDAQPVATVQAHDQTSDCAMIIAEIEANNEKVSALAAEKGLKVVQNTAAGVVGIVLFPVWFAMDAKGAAFVEATALESRQKYLTKLAEQRCAQRAR